MYDSYCKSLLDLKGFLRTSPIPRLRVLLQHSSSPLSSSYSSATSTSNRRCFPGRYLVHNCSFFSETASEASKHVSFADSEKPDSVLKLFRNFDISEPQLRDTIRRAPFLLSSDPVKTISPKLEFFKSKGASTSQLAHIVTNNPWFLQKSLANHIIPSYDLIKGFLFYDEKTIMSIKRSPSLLTDYRLAQKFQLLLDNGVLESGIALLLRHWPTIINFKIDELKMKVEEVKKLGFLPSKSLFIEALRAKVVVSKSTWERKVELYGRWGWSDEILNKAFTKRPFCMLTSDSKIEAVMEFWVNHMGWDALVLAENPILITLSLENRIIPRASVLQFLQSEGLIKNANSSPYIMTEEMFHRKFVNGFKKEAPKVLKLYKEKFHLSR